MPNENALTRPQDLFPEDEGMLRMSFLEHLEEARSRILKALAGVGVAFALSMYFGDQLWRVIAQPITEALRALGYPPRVIFTTPTEAFLTVWMEMPILAALFLASPWVLYQLWAFISPGLYPRERRWGAPFVITSAGLFVLGGAFGYFVVFRLGLMFLLGIGKNIGMEPMIAVSDYFSLFVEVMIGTGLVFELPALIFLLTLLGVVTPTFLIRQSRHAVIIIMIVAAVVTPTTDAFNLALFTAPMILLYFVGVLAGYVLVLRRDHRAFPWMKVVLGSAMVLLLGGMVCFGLIRYGGFHVASRWPFLVR